MLSKSVYVHSAWLRLRCGTSRSNRRVVINLGLTRWYLRARNGILEMARRSTVSSPAPSGEGPNSDTKSDTTMSDRVQASKLYDDPWEGSGACPARWERPFYQGAQIYAPREYPVQPGFVRRSNPGEPKFGGEAGQDLAVKRGKDATWQ